MSVRLRSKLIIAQYGTLIAVVLAVLGVLALGGAWSIYTSQSTHEVVETVDEQAFETSLESSAVVTGDTPLYERGATLTDQPVYFYNATSNVTLRVVTSVPDDRSVSVSQRLVLRHVAERADEPFWESRRLLASSEEVVDEGDATMNATVDMRAVRRTVAERRSEIGGVGSFRTVLQLRVDYETDGADDELAAAPTVVLTDRAYWFEGEFAADRTHSRTETRVVTDPPDRLRTLTVGGFGVGLLLLSVGVGALKRREFDLEAIEVAIVRNRYDEWISRGEIPTKSDRQYVALDTLEDLVDVAIDTNKRVIYDETYETYGVVDGDVVYYFTEADEDFGQWLEM